MKSQKLVRDKIPELIRANGEICEIRIAGSEEMPDLLRAKLQEEVAEYLSSDAPGELADILEVLYALATARHDLGPFGLDELREVKAQTRGRFRGRVVLTMA